MSATIGRGAAQHAGAEKLASIVYCSRAVGPLSPADLQGLLNVAQARNRSEQITGLVLYDQNRFYQWLEGPAPSVARIMDSINRDPRHTDLRILDDKPIESRFFADWDMKLATPDAAARAWVRDVLPAPRDITENLHQHPDEAPALLVKLMPLPAAGVGVPDGGSRPVRPAPGRVASLLRDVMLAAVIPQLAQEHGIEVPPELPIDQRLPELVNLLLAADQNAALEFMRNMGGGAGGLTPLFATLLEPAARSLGDMWQQDLCSEFDVTLGLCRMQTAVRLMGVNVALPSQSALVKPAVLVAPEPGELHHLTAAMDSEILTKAGWSPATAFPRDDAALQDMLAEDWFDALDLSLSAAQNRDHFLPRMAHTIQLARHASQNPALVVLVGGRSFVEQGNAGHQVGADAAVTTSRELSRAILRVLRDAKATRH